MAAQYSGRTTTPCLVCGAPVSETNARRAIGKGLYCSQSCFYARRDQPIIVSDDGTTAKVPLLNRQGAIAAYALIDAEDAPWVGQWRWCLNSGGYARRRDAEGGRTVLLHRELVGLPRVCSGPLTDHIDRDRLNCRRNNIRIVPQAGNRQNVPSRGGSSRHRGVTWDRRTGLWMAKVRANGKSHFLGRFASESQAAKTAREGRARLLPYAVD